MNDFGNLVVWEPLHSVPSRFVVFSSRQFYLLAWNVVLTPQQFQNLVYTRSVRNRNTHDDIYAYQCHLEVVTARKSAD